jgi:hypothetical protein
LKGKGREGIRRGKGEEGKQGKAQRGVTIKEIYRGGEDRER